MNLYVGSDVPFKSVECLVVEHRGTKYEISPCENGKEIRIKVRSAGAVPDVVFVQPVAQDEILVGGYR